MYSEIESENIHCDYTIKPDKVTNIVLAAKQEKSVGYIKKLHSTVDAVMYTHDGYGRYYVHATLTVVVVMFTRQVRS
jgi:hypothetical protein